MNQKKEISKSLKCLLLKNGIEIWKESERLEALKNSLLNLQNHFFVVIDEDEINTAEIAGIFSAKTMAEYTKRKNGEFKCVYGKWHGKFEKCYCDETEIKEYRKIKPSVPDTQTKNLSPNDKEKVFEEMRENLKKKLGWNNS